MDQVMTHTENETGAVTYVARMSLYRADVLKLEQFILDARKAAHSRGEEFSGLTIEIDSNAFGTVYAAGVEPIEL